MLPRKDKFRSPPPPPPPPKSESEFSFTLARVAVAQICQTMGLKRARNPALEALTDIATRYLRAIAKLSAAAANSDGRTQSNISDIVFAIEDLRSVQGFPGCSCVRSRSLFKSAVIKDLIIFVKRTKEIPFAQPLPPRRAFLRGSLLKCRDDRDWYGGARSNHVPRWLPVVPPVEENEKCGKREREVKWGCLESNEEKGVDNWEFNAKKMAKRESSNEMEMLEKRGKIRFKIGVVSGHRGVMGKSRGVIDNGE